MTNGDDCDDTNPVDPTISISIMENSAGMANDGFVCVNDNATLMASGGTDYEWSTGETTSTITVMPDYNSLYRVTVTLGTCKGMAEANLEIEGKEVTNSGNEGHGSLRSVMSCLIEGDTITYNQPTIGFSHITAPIIVSKNVTIEGKSQQIRPEIRLDYASMMEGFEIMLNKKLNLKNVDFKIVNGGGHPTVIGPGSMTILGLTEVNK